MEKQELILEIKTAFKNVKLEDGIGLWQGQGKDNYVDSEKLLELKNKDERENWENIPYQDIAECYSSLSFFDAKGMRFCLPKFLIFDLLEDELLEKEGIDNPLDIIFNLGYQLDEEYAINRFSLLDKKQILTIIHYIEFKLKKFIKTYKHHYTEEALHNDFEYIEINNTLKQWKKKLKYM